MSSFTPHEGVCPILHSNAVEAYGLSEKDIEAWCNKGCSTECGAMLKKKMERKGRKGASDE